ncbi:MAG: histidine kinase [Chloroflexota bacterium]|nr:histidine kinase [Chloroflexota bacterium]
MLDQIISLNPLLLLAATGASVISLLVAVIHLWRLRRKGALPKRLSKQDRKQRIELKKKRRREFAKEITQQLSDRHLRELYNILAELTATIKYQRVLDKALDLSMQALTSFDDPTDRMVGIVLLFSKSETDNPDLYIGASRRLTPADLPQTFPGAKGVLQEVIDGGSPVMTQEIAHDPELGRMIAIQNCASAYCIPLRQGIDTYGVILFGHPKRDFFNSSRREILNIITKQAVISIQNAQLYQDLEQEKERMMEIQEETRKKLARDLHDGPTQSIAAIAMRVNFARRLMERDQDAAADELYKIEDFARRTTKEIRQMLFTLRPLVLESKGLEAALQSMSDKMKETYNQKIVIEIDEEIASDLDMDKQGVIFYLVDEAVNNARKHAKADHVWVRLRAIQEDLAMLEIKDDGVGFDVDSVTASYEHSGSLGMINLRERADLVSGILRIDSTVGKGTSINVAIPLTEDAIDRIRHSV